MAPNLPPVVLLSPTPLPAPVPPRSNPWPYIVALVIVSLIGALSIVTITLVRPHEDNTAIYTQIVGMLLPTSAAILALIRVGQTQEAVKDVHISLNSRLSALLEKTELASRAAGKVEGRAEVKAEQGGGSA
jgi:hypothetical protein